MLFGFSTKPCLKPISSKPFLFPSLQTNLPPQNIQHTYASISSKLNLQIQFFFQLELQDESGIFFLYLSVFFFLVLVDVDVWFTSMNSIICRVVDFTCLSIVWLSKSDFVLCFTFWLSLFCTIIPFCGRANGLWCVVYVYASTCFRYCFELVFFSF